MAYRILSAAIVACLAATVITGPARAEQDLVDQLHPECRNTPISQMTRGQLQKCDAIERILGGIKQAYDQAQWEQKQKEDRAARTSSKPQSQGGPDWTVAPRMSPN